jgi:hypothetical protein
MDKMLEAAKAIAAAHLYRLCRGLKEDFNGTVEIVSYLHSIRGLAKRRRQS